MTSTKSQNAQTACFLEMQLLGMVTIVSSDDFRKFSVREGLGHLWSIRGLQNPGRWAEDFVKFCKNVMEKFSNVQ